MEIPKHHTRQTECATRAAYREGRTPKAVKVYTVNNESRYLLVQGVPSVGAKKNLLHLFSKYGEVEEHYALDEYPCEDKYTEVYLFKYKKIQASRFAKRKLDDYSFFGGTLHVCYAPEYEDVKETREKLLDRRRVIAWKISQNSAQTSKAAPGQSQPVQTESSIHNVNRQETAIERLDQDVNQPSSHVPNPPLLPPQYSVPPPPPFSVPPPPPPPSVPPPFSPRSTPLSFNPELPYPRQDFQTSSNFPTRPDQRDSSICQDSQTNAQFPKETFQLPAPPRQHLSQTHARPRRNHEFSRVPSSHATLPPGFDGRLNPDQAKTFSPHERHHKADAMKTESAQPKMSSNPASTVIRNFKPKTATPKFVPRQAIKRKAGETVSQNGREGKSAAPDPLDEQLRQNAFKLGRLQGPEHIAEKKETVKVEPAIEKSMITTIKSIRSKISQVISDSVKKPGSESNLSGDDSGIG